MDHTPPRPPPETGPADLKKDSRPLFSPFDTKSTAFFLEGGNNHLTFINCKVNNFAYGMRNKGRRCRSITLIGCGHEQVGLLFQLRGEAHNFTWTGCNLHQGHFGPLTDRVAEYHASGRFASHERGPISWKGCVNGEADAIYYQNKKYNLRGQPYPAGHSSETPGRKTASVELMD